MKKRHELESGNRQKKIDKHQKEKAQAFDVIVGQCVRTMKDRIKRHPDFHDPQRKCDVAGLLNKIRALAFGLEGAEPVQCRALHALKKLVNHSQGTKESVPHTFERFEAVKDIAHEHWGPFITNIELDRIRGETLDRPFTVAENLNENAQAAATALRQKQCDTQTEAASQQMLAVIFLHGADKHRFGKIQEKVMGRPQVSLP